ncbi:MAG: hypothetical protein AAGH41_05460 [Pseudomonadota bacterium]
MLVPALAAALALTAQSPITSDIVTTYEGVPEAAQIDFETAASIWETCLISDVPIHVHVKWMPGGPTGFAGHNSVRNKRYLPKRNVDYPTALASAMRGRAVTDEDDMNIFFRDKDNWHYAANDPIADGAIDFIKVALHEIGHGLGISSSVYIPWEGEPVATIGRPNDDLDYFTWTFTWPELNGTPELYDTFIKLADGRRITRDFEDGTPALIEALANPTIHFDGKHATAANYGFPVGVVPLNISHIPQFPRRPPPIMLAAGGEGVSPRHPDKILLGMLRDLGWEITDACLERAV